MVIRGRAYVARKLVQLWVLIGRAGIVAKRAHLARPRSLAQGFWTGGCADSPGFTETTHRYDFLINVQLDQVHPMVCCENVIRVSGTVDGPPFLWHLLGS